MIEPDTFTEPQAARILGVTAKTLYRWRKLGAVGYSLTPGGRIRYSPEDLRQLRAAMRVPAALGRT